MWSTIKALIIKELRQSLRDPMMIRLIFVMPIIQLFVLGYAINTDVKDIYTVVYDFDRSEMSREYVRSLSAGNYFNIRPVEFPVLNIDHGFRENDYTAALIIPNDFSNDMNRKKQPVVGLMVDGSNANSAAIALGYAGLITGQFNQRATGLSSPLILRQKKLYNPEAESVYFMIPGLITIMLTMITILLTSMAIVREREIGTLEQLMVTPIKKHELLLGKTIPFAIIGFMEMTVGLIIGLLWFKIPFVGSPILFYILAFIFQITALGIGIFISTISKTQQQAMFYGWFFTIFGIMTSGLFTPIENMPILIQRLTYLNPLRYFIKIIRAIMMKGATLQNLYPETAALIIFGLVIFSFAWMRFSKRVE